MSPPPSLPTPAIDKSLAIPIQNDRESCRSCLYTGVGTCVGLSAYFAHLALEGTDKEAAQRNYLTDRLDRSQGVSVKRFEKSSNNHGIREPMQKKQKMSSAGVSSNCIQNTLTKSFGKNKSLLVHRSRNRPFLWICSACWAAAGAYRLYLN